MFTLLYFLPFIAVLQHVRLPPQICTKYLGPNVLHAKFYSSEPNCKGLLSRKAGILLQICKFRGANKWRLVGFSQIMKLGEGWGGGSMAGIKKGYF